MAILRVKNLISLVFQRQDVTEEKIHTDPCIIEKQRFKPMIELPEPKVMKPIPEIPSEPQPSDSKLYPQVNQPAYR